MRRGEHFDGFRSRALLCLRRAHADSMGWVDDSVIGQIFRWNGLLERSGQGAATPVEDEFRALRGQLQRGRHVEESGQVGDLGLAEFEGIGAKRAGSQSPVFSTMGNACENRSTGTLCPSC